MFPDKPNSEPYLSDIPIYRKTEEAFQDLSGSFRIFQVHPPTRCKFLASTMAYNLIISELVACPTMWYVYLSNMLDKKGKQGAQCRHVDDDDDDDDDGGGGGDDD